MRDILSEDGETREFLVVLPKGAYFDDPATQIQIQEELARTFPTMKFALSTEGGVRQENGFAVYPLLGATDTNQPLLNWPSFDVLEDVIGCLAGFIVKAESETNRRLN